MDFDLTIYGPVAHSLLLAADCPGRRMPLIIGDCSNQEARAKLKNKKASDIFPKAADIFPKSLKSGVYFPNFV